MGQVIEFFQDRLDSIWNTLSGFGMPDRDKGAAGRPAPFVPLHPQELKWLYRGNGHARRAVDSIADHTTVKGWAVNVPITDDDDDNVDDDDTGLDVMHAEDTRLHVWSKTGDAYRWARRDGGAWLMIVTDEDFAGDDTGLGEKLAQPLNMDGIKKVDNLVVLTRDDVTPFSYNGDIRDDGFRDVKIYNVTMTAGGDIDRAPGVHSIEGRSIRVHHSRMIYFAGATISARERFENGGVDDSILQSWWDQIRNLTTIEQAGANLSQEMALHVVKIGGLDNMESFDQIRYFEQRTKMLARSKSSVGLIVLGDDEEYKTLAANVSGFKEFQGSAKDALAAVAGLPQTELFGQAPGGLSTDDAGGRTKLNTLYETIQTHRLKDPLVEIYTVLFAQKEGPTSGAVPDEWKLEFHPVQAKTDDEQASLEKTHAETDALRITSQVVTPEHVTESRFGPAGYQNQLAAVDIDALETSVFEEVERLRAELDDARAVPMPGAAEPGEE